MPLLEINTVVLLLQVPQVDKVVELLDLRQVKLNVLLLIEVEDLEALDHQRVQALVEKVLLL